MYKKVADAVLKNTNLFKPNMFVTGIHELDFQKMHDMGMEKVIFEKENTIFREDKCAFYSKKAREAFQKASEVFGKDHTLIFSNDNISNEFQQKFHGMSHL